MPLFKLTDEVVFPNPTLAEQDGLLALGGDLKPDRLLLAYRNGIFPWYSKGEPILWWSPDPRFVLFPSKLHVSKSIRPILNNPPFTLTFDRAFEQVIRQCKAVPRPGQEGTWITEEMQAAYCDMHQLGWAHSVEVWEGDQLVGGVYGISMGQAFCGESMFAKVSDASKFGFIKFVRWLESRNFSMVDCQVYTDHLSRFGAEEIPRSDFLKLLDEALQMKSIQGSWTIYEKELRNT